MRTLKSSLATLTATAGSMLLLAGTAHAEAVQSIPVQSVDINGNGGTLQDIINTLGGNIINVVLLIAGVLAVLFLIYNGVVYITSAGNADRVKSARAGIINAVIGIIVIVATYFIIRFAVGIGNSVGSATGQ